LAWYDDVRRELPWRQSNDFYRVWLSEIMLQQTRVEAVIPYFHRFLGRFPDIQALAAAAEPDVLAAWSGLGYYSRARLLHRAAKQVASTGIPEDLRALPGIGEYTAAAVGSIALGLPVAAVDGNVLRVVSRVTNDGSEINLPATRKRFQSIAQSWLDTARPGDFNQAMMELGATVCTPRSPDCGRCPIRSQCAARAAGTQSQLPVKLGKARVCEVALDVLVLERRGRIFLVQRGAGERRLRGFWELPEKNAFAMKGEIAGSVAIKAALAGGFRHQIVNDRFQVTVWRAAAPSGRIAGGKWFRESDLATMPITTVTRKALARL
jgi:A/G-specific adenine glycosylase